jgi:transposase
MFPEAQGLLQRLYRQSRHHQVRQRALLSIQDYSIAQLMDIFGVSRKTLYNWFNHWESQGIVGLYNRPGRGRKSTFNLSRVDSPPLGA